MDTGDGMLGAWLLAQAGWTMVPLVGCSLVLVAATLRLVWLYATDRVTDDGLLDTLPVRLGPEDVRTLATELDEDRGVMPRVLGRVAEAVEQVPAAARDEAARVVGVELERLERPLGLIALIGRIAPLFGLLGTVLGMVELFGAMESAGGQTTASTLAGGIWKALLTTAAGLIVAIPALMIHAWALGRLSRLRGHLEDGIGRLLQVVDRA